jgi:putative endonuclease
MAVRDLLCPFHELRSGRIFARIFTSRKVNKTYCVYILASRSRNLYAGVTNNLHRRVAEHREGRTAGFTSKYNIFRLVHYEVFSDIRNAIAREKEIKAWRREKKVSLIERGNPTWHDLAEEWFGIGRKQNANAAAPQNATNAEEAEKARKADPSPPSKIRPGSG